jgi:hypothetical protein
MQRLENPLPLFLDLRGSLLDAGYIYVGTPDDDPETNQIQLYWDPGLTIEAEQPLRTRGGYIVDNVGAPSMVFIGDVDYSMMIRDADGNQVGYSPSASASGGVSYQPLDDDLTAIALLATTAFGRGVLTQANAAAIRAYIGVVDSIPKTGGTVTGNISRSGGGPHLYYAAAATSGKIFRTVNTAGDPTSQDGDIWLKYAP